MIRLIGDTHTHRRPTLVAIILAVLAAGIGVREAGSHNPITTTVLFNREIAALFNTKCAQCHIDGGMAMSLQTYPQARPWAVAIKEEALARRMPPWPAERGYGTFANDVSLTQRELEFLVSWINGGTPEGIGMQPPQFHDHSGHWMLGSPDGEYVATPDPDDRATTGTARFIVDTGLRTDAWVRALDLKMPDRRTARAAFYSLLETGEYLGGWTPWHTSTEFPAGAAFRLPAGARIAVDVLHGPEPVSAPPQLGLYFSPDAAHALKVLRLATAGRAGDRRLNAAQPLREALAVVGLRAEMSAGGKSIEVRARRADGGFEPLVWIKDFRQDWQVPFILERPVVLPPGSVLQATSYFDGSEASSSAGSTVHVIGYEPEALETHEK